MSKIEKAIESLQNALGSDCLLECPDDETIKLAIVTQRAQLGQEREPDGWIDVQDKEPDVGTYDIPASHVLTLAGTRVFEGYMNQYKKSRGKRD